MSMGNVLVAAEAFVLGVKAGMEPARLLEILRGSAGRSYHFEKRFPNILARNFAPGFTVDLARKDLGLAVDMARSHDVPVPATSLLHQLYNACAALGEGTNDFAAIIKLFESWARMEVKGPDPRRRLRLRPATTPIGGTPWIGFGSARWADPGRGGRRAGAGARRWCSNAGAGPTPSSTPRPTGSPRA